jgi:hypothetical protein
MPDSNVANAAKESTQGEFSHGLHGNETPAVWQAEAQNCSSGKLTLISDFLQ